MKQGQLAIEHASSYFPSTWGYTFQCDVLLLANTKPMVTSLFIILKWVCFVLRNLNTWAECEFSFNIHCWCVVAAVLREHIDNPCSASQSSPDFVTIPVNTALHVHVWELVPTVIQCASTSSQVQCVWLWTTFWRGTPCLVGFSECY